VALEVGRLYRHREAGGRLDVGFSDGAIPLLRTRLQMEPDHVESLYNLGMVYSDRMRLKQARELLGRAVELDPGDANAQVAQGIAALRDNDPEAAQSPLEKAVLLEPRNPDARRSLGQLLLMQADPAAALPHLRAGIDLAREYELARGMVGGESAR
jgi:cytochrome c-type biogenesis protein CcmH/NrfG